MIYQTVYDGSENSPMQIIQAFLLKLFNDTQNDEKKKELDLSKLNIHKLFFDALNLESFFPKRIFYFNGNAKFPFSQQIEDALYEMTVCGSLSRPNPTMVKYNFISLDKTSYDNLDNGIKKFVDKVVEDARNSLRVCQ
jgi:hypothetical protein